MATTYYALANMPIAEVYALQFTLPIFTIIGAVISIANSLNVGVVIEGIESPLQLRRVQALGAKLVQGFLFSHPMPLPEARAWLDDRTRPRVPEAQAALNGP